MKLPARAPREPHSLFSMKGDTEARKAVVPVFIETDFRELRGMGTAFQIDGGQTLLTASHVLADFPHGNPRERPVVLFTTSRPNYRAYGQVPVPKGSFAPIESSHSIEMDVDDPLAALSGRATKKYASDITVMRTASLPPDYMRAAMPLRLIGYPPAIGDRVLAIGFPHLTSDLIDQENLTYLLREGMYGAYGTVVALHPHGRDRANLTPVIEVEANWRSGMSGGPVLNEDGEVVGIVSRSVDFKDGTVGRAWASCFAYAPWVAETLGRLG